MAAVLLVVPVVPVVAAVLPVWRWAPEPMVYVAEAVRVVVAVTPVPQVTAVPVRPGMKAPPPVALAAGVGTRVPRARAWERQEPRCRASHVLVATPLAVAPLAVAPGPRPKPRAGRAALRHRSGHERAGAQRCYECVDLDCRMQLPRGAAAHWQHSTR